MKRSLSILLFAAFLACGVASAQTAAPAATAASAERPGDASKSWTIVFDRTAKSDGQIRFQLWQNDEAAPRDIVLPVTKGQTENSMALALKELLRDQLGVKEFETNNKKDRVFCTVKRGERRFSIKLAENTVDGVKIDLYAR